VRLINSSVGKLFLLCVPCFRENKQVFLLHVFLA
jgi:hypothetical protein